MRKTLLAAGAIALLYTFAPRPSRLAAEERPPNFGITILDERGEVVPPSSPAAPGQIFDVTVGPGGSLTFSPATIDISAGDTVRWTWASNRHSVTSGSSCSANSQFCSPNNTNCGSGNLSDTGTVYQFTFTQPGTYSYFCAVHCGSGMTGTVRVAATCAQPPSNMVGWFPGDGNPNDVALGNNGSMQGTATFAPGKVGQAFSFDGNGFMQAPHTDAIDPLTAGSLDAWVMFTQKPSQAGRIMALLSGGGFNDDFDLLAENFGDKFQFSVRNGQVVTSQTSIQTGVWYHVVGTWDSAAGQATSGIKIYVNGVLENTNPALVTRLQHGDPFTLAVHPVFGGRAFVGLIDEAEVFSRALTASEVATLFSAGSLGKCRACATLPSGMVSWWPGEGNTVDGVGSNNGTLQGFPSFDTGKVGYAFSFNGFGQAMLIGDPLNLRLTNAITLQAWVRPARTPDENEASIITKWAGAPGAPNIAGDAYGIWLTQAGGALRLTAAIGDGTTSDTGLVGATDIPLNQWTHVAMTYNASTGQNIIYVNGVQDGSRTRTGGIVSNNTQVYVGRQDSSAAPRFFPGRIDEVQVFNGVLTAQEIAASANSGFFGTCKPPLQLVSAVSRKVHGSTTAFDVNMPVTGQTGVECRTGGANNDHTLVLSFSNGVVSGSAGVTSGTGSVSGSPAFSGHDVAINLTGVANAQTIVLALSNLADAFSQALATVPLSASFLLGDTNGDRVVNSGDAIQTRSRSGQSTDATNFRSDVTVDGFVNAGDTIIVRARSGTGLVAGEVAKGK